MNIINHPESYKDGIRVLMLASRNKDGAEKSKPIIKVSRSLSEYDSVVSSLVNTSYIGQRIYSSAAPRDVEKAIRAFKSQQLDSDYDDDNARHEFYFNCKTRFISCLSKPQNVVSGRKVWMFDADTDYDVTFIEGFLKGRGYIERGYYKYPTKNGFHYLLRPFQPLGVSFGNSLNKNPMMLVGY